MTHRPMRRFADRSSFRWRVQCTGRPRADEVQRTHNGIVREPVTREEGTIDRNRTATGSLSEFPAAARCETGAIASPRVANADPSSPAAVTTAPERRARHRRGRGRVPAPATAPTAVVVDGPGLEALIGELARRTALRLRHGVPHRAHLRPGSRAHPDRLARQDRHRRPAGGRPRAARRGVRRPRDRCGPCGGPGSRRADGRVRRRARGRLRHADRRGVPGALHAVAVPPRRPDAGACAPQGRPPLRLAPAPHVRRAVRLRRQRCGLPPRAAYRARGTPPCVGPPRLGARRVRHRAGRPHPGPRARGGLVEARRHTWHGASLPAPWHRRWPPGASGRRPRPTVPAGPCCRTSD